jgi:hypothetical protein
LNRFFDRSIIDKSKFFQPGIFGILLTTIGFAFLYNPTRMNLRLCSVLILLGINIILILTNKNITKENIKESVYNNLIFFLLTAWIFIIFYITRDADVDIFLIAVILGMFFIINFVEEYVSPKLKKRMNILFYILIIMFTLIIGQKIISILSI